jgi:hypothetical protein
LSLFSVSPIEDKNEKPPLEVIEAELQTVLNTLTEHGFQDAFKNMAEVLGTVHTLGRGLLRG